MAFLVVLMVELDMLWKKSCDIYKPLIVLSIAVLIAQALYLLCLQHSW